MMNGKPVSARVWATSKTGGYEQDLTGTDGTYELMIAGNDLWRVAAIAEIDRCIYRANETPLPIGAQSSMTFDLPLIATRSCLPDPVSSTFDAAQPLVLENAVGVKVAPSRKRRWHDRECESLHHAGSDRRNAWLRTDHRQRI